MDKICNCSYTIFSLILSIIETFFLSQNPILHTFRIFYLNNIKKLY